MDNQSSADSDLNDLLAKNEGLITYYYKLAALLLIAVLIPHIALSALFLIYVPAHDIPGVLQFVVFNVTILVVEVFLSRIAFMLGSRSGQLRDLRCTVLIASHGADPARPETAARAMMSLRRDADSLNVIDVETFASALPKK